MKKYIFVAAIALLGAVLLFSGSDANAPAVGQVQNLVVMDAPNDGGSVLQLKWTPLDKSHRIIQYNIYRGASPDSLFYISNLEVDPKLGVIGKELTFLDQGGQPLFSFETAPGSLKKVKGQAPGAPIYGPVPRDPALIAKLLDDYSITGEINRSDYYKRSKKITTKDGVMAGLSLKQFTTIYATPITNKTYYYTVIAVNERGQFMPAAKISSAAPLDNRPEPSAIVHATLVQDKNELGFEWSPPNNGPDVAEYSGWLMPKDLIPRFKEDQLANQSAPDSVFSATWQSGSIQIYDAYASTGTLNQYNKVDLAEAEISLPRPAADYVPVLCYKDYSGYQNAAMDTTLYVKNSSDLPAMPAFSIHDKKNDKGDNLLISIGKPVAYITQASYTSDKRDRLKINFETLENEMYPLERIRFSFQDTAGKALGTVTEYYPDKIITLKLPKGFAGTKLFKASIEVMLRGTGVYEKPAALQDIVLEEKINRYVGSNLSVNGVRMNEIFLDVFTQTKLYPSFTPGMRSNGMVRMVDHPISYETVIYRQISGYDARTRRFEVDPTFQVATDEKTGLPFTGHLFRDEFTQDLKESAALIDSLQTRLKTLAQNPADTLGAEYQALGAELTQTRQIYDFTMNHPACKLALAAKGDSGWRKALIAEMDQNSRTYAYQLLMTDGKGFFQQTDTFKTKDGIWFFPHSEWFDKSKLATLIGTLLFGALLIFALYQARRKELYVRPIAGLEELDNAVGRATEMGRPVMMVPGWGYLESPCTVSFLMILNQLAYKTAEFDVRLISPHVDYMVLPVAQEIVQSAYNEAGRPDSFNRDDIFFISDSQFAFAAGVNGITIRERVATVIYMGFFNAEALLMTETGNQTGAIQIAGTDAITQVPFFITTCDYTLIGEEFYAAAGYLSKNVELVSMLKAQDYFKLIIVVLVLFGTILSTLHINSLLHFLPFE